MRTLVAGVGNVFFGDDGFGVEVARRLLAEPLPPGVEVWDAGIRGLHLAYRLLDGYDLFVAVNLIARGGPPGTLYVLQPEVHAVPGGTDAHSVDLRAVLAMVGALGGRLGRVRVVGCEPADLGERMGLSPAVEAAVAPALRLVRALAEGVRDDAREG